MNNKVGNTRWIAASALAAALALSPAAGATVLTGDDFLVSFLATAPLAPLAPSAPPAPEVVAGAEVDTVAFEPGGGFRSFYSRIDLVGFTTPGLGGTLESSLSLVWNDFKVFGVPSAFDAEIVLSGLNLWSSTLAGQVAGIDPSAGDTGYVISGLRLGDGSLTSPIGGVDTLAWSTTPDSITFDYTAGAGGAGSGFGSAAAPLDFTIIWSTVPEPASLALLGLGLAGLGFARRRTG